jgi:hypothetical protein
MSHATGFSGNTYYPLTAMDDVNYSKVTKPSGTTAMANRHYLFTRSGRKMPFVSRSLMAEFLRFCPHAMSSSFGSEPSWYAIPFRAPSDREPLLLPQPLALGALIHKHDRPPHGKQSHGSEFTKSRVSCKRRPDPWSS